MKIQVVKRDFRDIKTVISYSENNEKLKVYYLGSTKKILGRNLSMYNFFLNPSLESDEFLINLLGSHSLGVVSDKSDVKVWEMLEDSIFPTISEESNKNLPSFFGAISISDSTVISVLLPEGVKKVLLFDELVEGEIDNQQEAVEVILEENEIHNSKFMWITTSTKGDGENRINIALTSWLSSVDPCRNMKEYLVRNDRRVSTTYLPVLKNLKENMIVDRWTGNLLGTSKVSKPKLLLNRSKSSKTIGTLYKEVNKGFVLQDKNSWICLSNLGRVFENTNTPIYSSDWVTLDSFNSVLTKRISVVSNPPNTGDITPNSLITVTGNPEEFQKEFKVRGKFGFVLNKETPCSYSKTDPILQDKYTISDNGDGSFNINIIDWSDIIKTGTLLFNFSGDSSYLTLVIVVGEEEIPYSRWEELGISISKFLVGGEEVEPVIVEDSLEVTPKSDLSIYLSSIGKYSIASINSDHSSPKLTDLGDNIYLIESEVSFKTDKFKLGATLNYISVTIENIGEIQTSNNYINSESGKDAEFMFYGDFKELVVNGEVTITKDNLGEEINIGRGAKILVTQVKGDMYKVNLQTILTDLNIVIC